MISRSRKLTSVSMKYIRVAALISCWCAAVIFANFQPAVELQTEVPPADVAQQVSTTSITAQTQVEVSKLVVIPKLVPMVHTDLAPAIKSEDQGIEEEIKISTLELPKEDEKNQDEATPTNEGFVYLEDLGLSEELQLYTWEVCQEKDLRYTMVLALMKRESGYQEDAVGYNTNGTTDSGLMQLNDETRPFLKRELGITDLMNPYNNIDGGTEILVYHMEQFGSETGMLMAYQYGEGGAQRKFNNGIYWSDAMGKLYRFEEEIIRMLQDAHPDIDSKNM